MGWIWGGYGVGEACSGNGFLGTSRMLDNQLEGAAGGDTALFCARACGGDTALCLCRCG